MYDCDVLIVGGGPAGSSCAWKLRNSGLRVAVLDRDVFPRDKVCGGWVTPEVFRALELSAEEYKKENTLQEILGFRVGSIGDEPIEVAYRSPVSFGIRRREFDTYLLARCGAERFEGKALEHLERSEGMWLVNSSIRARVLVGAGGHFCPVAKCMGSHPNAEVPVVAQEVEFQMTPDQMAACQVKAEVPELYFCGDMLGYGWCFRKQNLLNVGIGRLDKHELSTHATEFLRYLESSGRVCFDVPALKGHAYLLRGSSPRRVADDGVLLIGDAAGLAYPQSGEGILPAVESGLLAGEWIAAHRGRFGVSAAEAYRRAFAMHFAFPSHQWLPDLASLIPSNWRARIARSLLHRPWFVRKMVIDDWFLHAA